MAARIAKRETESLNGHSRTAGTLKNRAYQWIKARLLSNEYPPGSFMSERQLAQQLGMSKTPVKAALERLGSEGFITVSPQQGVVVREMSVHEIADLYEIRAALESYTLRTVAGRLTPAQAGRIRTNLEAQAQLRATGNVASGVELDAAFHALFVEFLGNGEIQRTVTQLREKMQRVITQVFRLCPSRIDTSYDEHVAIADAVLRGEGALAADLLVQHLERGKRLILSPRG